MRATDPVVDEVRRVSWKGLLFNKNGTKSILRGAGLVATDQDEEIPLLFSDNGLRRVVTNNGKSTWFYTASRRLDLPQYQHVDESGRLVEGKGDTENTVGNWPTGSWTNHLTIESDSEIARATDPSEWISGVGYFKPRFLRGRAIDVTYQGTSDQAPLIYGRMPESPEEAAKSARRQVESSSVHLILGDGSVVEAGLKSRNMTINQLISSEHGLSAVVVTPRSE